MQSFRNFIESDLSVLLAGHLKDSLQHGDKLVLADALDDSNFPETALYLRMAVELGYTQQTYDQGVKSKQEIEKEGVIINYYGIEYKGRYYNVNYNSVTINNRKIDVTKIPNPVAAAVLNGLANSMIAARNRDFGGEINRLIAEKIHTLTLTENGSVAIKSLAGILELIGKAKQYGQELNFVSRPGTFRPKGTAPLTNVLQNIEATFAENGKIQTLIRKIRKEII